MVHKNTAVHAVVCVLLDEADSGASTKCAEPRNRCGGGSSPLRSGRIDILEIKAFAFHFLASYKIAQGISRMESERDRALQPLLGFSLK